MKDVGEHKNLGVGVVGNLNKEKPTEDKEKSKAEKITKKKLKEGTVNKGSRTAKVEYLRSNTEMVGVINEKGDTVWVMESNGTFTKTKIY